MAWYRTGTVTVTNGSPVVTGAGTDFVANGNPADIFLGPDGRVYEVASVQSATQLTLASPYQSAGAGGQGFALAPTQSFAHDLALGVAQLITSFAAVRDGFGQGLIPDGSAAAPALRFFADQDTGLRRSDANTLALVGGGVDLATVSQVAFALASGIKLGVGTNAPISNFDIAGTANAYMRLRPSDGTDFAIGANFIAPGTFGIYDYKAVSTRLMIDAAGNLVVGANSATFHRINKAVSEGGIMVAFGSNTTYDSLVLAAAGTTGWSSASAVAYFGRNTTTGRSANFGGTINTSGADYAEYMTKADSCGEIAKGDVCGVDREGKLTRTWADAVSFVVKSTDPSYVGGDSWAAHLPPRPERADDEEQDTFADRLITWEADHEAARQCVDRIAFSGQVPVNVTGDFAVGDYLIAEQEGEGIKAVAVPESDITFEQYRSRLGKVWAIRDGRAWIDVQHG